MYQNNWSKEDVRSKLASELETPEFLAAYQQLRTQFPALLWLVQPETLIARLHSENCDYAEKDRILYALVAASQRSPELRQSAFTLLSLALWPALEHSYYKLSQLAACLPDLWAEIQGNLLDAVMRFNLAKHDRLAINLQFNVEKAVRARVERETQAHGLDLAVAFLDADFNVVLEEPYHNRSASIKEVVSGIPAKAMKQCMRGLKARSHRRVIEASDREVLSEAMRSLEEQGLISADERLLLTAHILDDIELCEIARVRGMSSGALRARYFRLKSRLQKHFQTKERNAA